MPNLRLYEITAIKLLRDNAGTAEEVDLDWGNQANFQTVENDITFEGSGKTSTLYVQTGLTIDLQNDSWDLGSLATVLGKTPVTGITDVEERYYFGPDDAGISCGVAAYGLAVDDDDNSIKKDVRIVAPVGNLSAVRPPNMQAKNKAPATLRFSALKTTVDIAGTALPSVPASGTFWYYDILS